MTDNLELIKQQAYAATKELLQIAKLNPGQILVIGCSTSEVGGAGIGTFSSPELAEKVFAGNWQINK